ncbi:PucR family transcriptional regulator ligand-binding domain-containing protein [Streptomyces sp. NPDC031705]|uniref:PucR family transcriptional regulator ligand-binding domain-containing protein n=1 Tax=Streptomyces sp. NPDC031705 TaxID=3155729 RepID=UPI0033F47FC7
MQVRDVILSGGPRPFRFLGGGEEGLQRPVLAAVTIDLPDPGRFVSPGDLVLSGLVWLRQHPGRAETFVRILAEAGAAALGAGEAEFGNVPDDMVRACARYGLPLFAVGVDVPFGPVAEFVARGRSGARVGNLAALVDRHRRLVASRPGSGAGAGALLELLLSELDLRAHVLSPTGRLIAGARPPLPERTAAALAGRFLAGERSGRRAPHRTAAGGLPYSLFPVRSAPGAGPALTDWTVAVEADCGDWHDERIGLVERLAGLIAVERAGRDADRTVRRRAAGRLLGLLDSRAAAGGRALVQDAAGRLAAEGPAGEA